MRSLSQNLRTSLKILNSHRKPYNIARAFSYGGLALIIGLVLFVFSQQKLREPLFAFLDRLPVIPPMLSLCVAGGILWIPFLIPYIISSKTYEDFFNQKFLHGLAEENPGFNYEQQGIDRSEFEQSDIFDPSQIDRYYSYQKFFSEKERIKTAWIKTEGFSNSQGVRRPLFYGQFLQIVLEKELPPLLILPQKTMASQLKKITGIYEFKKPSLSSFKTGNPSFEKHFICYGSPVSEISELTTVFMEKYKILKKPLSLSLNGKKISLAVYGETKFKLPIKKMTLDKTRHWKGKIEFYISFAKSFQEIFN